MHTKYIGMMAAVVGASLTLAGYSQSGSIVGTKHDMSAKPWNPTQTLCGVCHTPHNSIAAQPALWNHQVTAAVFTVYASPTMNSVAGQPGGTSKLCLSCHDGTVALENYGGVNNGVNLIAGAANVGTDLSNDHPISITYDAALATADGALFNPAVKEWNGVGSGFISAKMLFANKVECASCHNVHDNQFTKFLRKANTGSALCLTCHNK